MVKKNNILKNPQMRHCVRARASRTPMMERTAARRHISVGHHDAPDGHAVPRGAAAAAATTAAAKRRRVLLQERSGL